MFKLNELIKEKGLRITKVMDVMDISQSTLRDLRVNNHDVRLSQVQKVIKFYKFCGISDIEILRIIEEEED